MPEFMMEYLSNPERIIQAISMGMFASGLICGMVLVAVDKLMGSVAGYFREKIKMLERQNEEKDNEKRN